jgi:hypothetical protein
MCQVCVRACVGARVFMCSFVNVGVEKGVKSEPGQRRQSMHLSLDILLVEG